jgi:hypothetical protein
MPRDNHTRKGPLRVTCTPTVEDVRATLLLGGFALLGPILVAPEREAFVRAIVLTVLVIILVLVIRMPMPVEWEWPMFPSWPALPVPLI